MHSLIREPSCIGVTGRGVRVPELGDVTLGEPHATRAVHDLDHLAQVYSALAASRHQAVGPWKSYLGILLRRDAAKSRG